MVQRSNVTMHAFLLYFGMNDHLFPVDTQSFRRDSVRMVQLKGVVFTPHHQYKGQE